MKTKKSDLLEFQNLHLEWERARAPRKAKLQNAMDRIKNRVPEYLVERVEEFISKGRMPLVPEIHGTCGGCHLMLPGGIANHLAATDELFLCENCGAFVYWESFERSESTLDPSPL